MYMRGSKATCTQGEGFGESKQGKSEMPTYIRHKIEKHKSKDWTFIIIQSNPFIILLYFATHTNVSTTEVGASLYDVRRKL